MDGERWNPVCGYEGLYEVSSRGRVKTLRSDRLLTPHPDGKGYPVVKLYDGRGGVKTAKVHLLVIVTFVGPQPGMQCNHKNGIKADNCIENLEWTTGSENVRHAWQHGLNKPNRGESHGCHKITETQAREIKELRGQCSQRKLALRYGISQTEVWMIQTGRNWSHV